MVSVLVFLAAGAEEMEAVISIDVLRRAGFEVTVAGLDGPDAVLCSRKVSVVPDVALEEVKDKAYDVLVCPGGLGGAEKLACSSVVGVMLQEQMKRGACIAAICAGPLCLLSHSIGKGLKLTSHPSVKDKLSEVYSYQEDRVVRDGHLITSRGPGTAFEFALEIVDHMAGKEKSLEISPPMLLNF